MSNRVKVSLTVLWLTAAAGSAIAQKSPKPGRNAQPEGGKVASLEEPDFTRFRVVTDQGILAVFDADEEWDGRDEPASQLAYWNDFASEQLFFFDRLLFTDADVLQSVAVMQRDLQIDPAPILSEKPEFSPLPEITSPGQWRLAIELDVLNVMAGGFPGAGGEGGVSGTMPMPCDPWGLCAAEPPAVSGSLSAPVRGTSQNELLALAQRGSRCICPGGGACNIPNICLFALFELTCPVCDDNPCTAQYGHCADGWCNPHPTTAPCQDDGNPCTNDVCSNLVCTHPPKCDDGDPCTNDCADGDCSYTPKCSSDGTACTTDCVNGVCTYTPLSGVGCESDGNSCTQDICTNGQCTYPPLSGTECESDGNSCTQDFCYDGECEHEEIPCGDDGDPCTDADCTGGGCQHVPSSGASCEGDNDPCTPDYCLNGECVIGHPNCESTENPCNPNPIVNHYPVCEQCVVNVADAVLDVNCDDDDNDGTIDLEEDGPIIGEDDLVPVQLTWTAGCSQIAAQGDVEVWRIAEGHGNRTFRVFRNPDKTEPIDSLAGYNDWPPPSIVWLEGISGTDDDCPSRLVIWVGSSYASGGVCIYCGYESGSIFIREVDLLRYGAQPLSDQDEIEPGGVVCLNDDDDNGNARPDFEDTGLIFMDDDLIPVSIGLLIPLLDPENVELSAPAGGSRIKVYANQDRSGPINLSHSWNSDELPETVYVEGVGISSVARDTELRAQSSTCGDKVNLTVERTNPIIEVQYKTFIAAAAVKLPVIDYYFNGNNRNFGYGTTLSSKSVQSASVSMNPTVSNGPVNGATQFFGISIGYDDDPDGEDIATGQPWPCAAYNLYPIAPPQPDDDCEQMAIPGVDPNVLTMIYQRVSPTEIKVDITLVGENACQQYTAPNIDAHLHIHFRQTCENGVISPTEFRLYGTHDGFPWHELYINGVGIYKHDVCLTNEGPTSLGGDEEWRFEDLSPTHPPYDGNDQLGLDQWRVVPGLTP